MEEEWDLRLTSWYIRKGFLKGTAANLRDALDEQNYAQLRNVRTAYRNVLPLTILEHLNDRWCPLDVQARKQLRQNYYTPWNPEEHLTAFGMRLTNDQVSLIRSEVTISDDDKLQFYLEQMYESNTFDKMEMMTWENQPTATKTDFNLARDYFEKLIKSYDTYEQNAGTGAQNTYDSASRLADVGDKLREYINQIASANAQQKEDAAANVNHSKEKDLAADVKRLTEAVAKLTKMVADKENAPPSNSNTGTNNATRKQYTGVRNYATWEPTATAMDTIQREKDTQVQHASTRRRATRMKQPGVRPSGETIIGRPALEYPPRSKTIQRTKVKLNQPPDRDWGQRGRVKTKLQLK
jgi:hypothetical protein